MATCNECIYNPHCISRISYGMGDDEVTGKLLPDIEKRCPSFKSNEQFIDLSNADISALFMYAKRALGAGIRETQFNVRCSPNDKVLSAKYVKLKRLYNLAKELRQKSIYYSKREG